MATEPSPSTPSAAPSSPTFDAAALAVATAAGAISVFLAPGPYDWLSGIIGLTLIGTVWAYEYSRQRTRMQSLALSMSTAFISLLIIGLYLEWDRSGLGLREWVLGGRELVGLCPVEEDLRYTPACPKDAESAVETVWLAWAWLIVTGVVFLLDRVLQGRRGGQQQRVTGHAIDERRASLSD